MSAHRGPGWFARSAKAVGAWFGAAQTAVVTTMTQGGADSLGDLSQFDWLVIVGTVVGTGAAVYGVSNAENKRSS